jgi:hypothetical protein
VEIAMIVVLFDLFDATAQPFFGPPNTQNDAEVEKKMFQKALIHLDPPSLIHLDFFALD